MKWTDFFAAALADARASGADALPKDGVGLGADDTPPNGEGAAGLADAAPNGEAARVEVAAPPNGEAAAGADAAPKVDVVVFAWNGFAAGAAADCPFAAPEKPPNGEPVVAAGMDGAPNGDGAACVVAAGAAAAGWLGWPKENGEAARCEGFDAAWKGLEAGAAPRAAPKPEGWPKGLLAAGAPAGFARNGFTAGAAADGAPKGLAAGGGA